MYNSYFGFREKPFKLVPNPDYLFLSKSHEIALAHLTYATDQGEGFVVITGEVGTGKTTLCRNYLESLDEQTSSAYIFNPSLESSQLLSSICAEFGIKTEATRVKSLIDLLNGFLIGENSEDRKVLLLIDEAQGLSVENLELVRMLSNLETTRSKLLQIILVGQPELADKLDSYELRQLSQRISLNYHLSPLTSKETESYIKHRLSIATQRQAVQFTANACRAAYQFSGGIPRLINIVCDRALLLAFSSNRPKVSKGIMQSAIRELLSRGQAKRVKGQWAYIIVGSALLATVAVLVAFFIWRGENRTSEKTITGSQRSNIASSGIASSDSPSMEQTFRVPQPVVAAPTTSDDQPQPSLTVSGPGAEASAVESRDAEAAPSNKKAFSNSTVADEVNEIVGESLSKPDAAPIEEIIATLDPKTARKHAVSVLLRLWQQPRPNPNLLPDQLEDPMFYDLAARQYGLRLYTTQWDWALVQRLDLPVIIALRKKDSSENVFLALTGESNGRLQLSQGGTAPVIDTDLETLTPHLAGPIYLFWRNTIGFDMLIGRGANRNAVLGIKHLLRQIGYHEVPLNHVFDNYTKDVVKTFQERNELAADGLVGPLTKIMLLREADYQGMPHLKSGQRADP